MQTIDEAKSHCRDVGEGIEKMVSDSGALSYFGNEEMEVSCVTETKNKDK